MNSGEQKINIALDSRAASFLSVVIAGYAVHLFAFTNLIPNIDGLSRIYDYQDMLMSGRWFLHTVSFLHGFVEAPALIGTLSLLFLGASAALIADLLEIHSLPASILTGAFLVINIAWAYTYTFIFTASAYAAAIFLAVLAVWLAARRKYGWIAGGIILAFSLGIYQAYISTALSLALIWFIQHLFRPSSDSKDFTKGNRCAAAFFRLAGMFIIGALLYVIILEICLHVSGTALSNYRGMNSFGTEMSAAALGHQIIYVYGDFCRYLFTEHDITLHGSGWIVLNVAAAVLMVILQLIQAMDSFRQDHDRFRGIILWLLLGLFFFPFAINFTSFLNPSSMWMRFSFCFYYIYCVVLAERVICSRKAAVQSSQAQHSGRWQVASIVPAAVLAAILLFHAQYANTVYTALDLAHKATQSFLTTLVARVQGTAGYRSDMEVVIIGTPDAALYQNGVPQLKDIQTSASSADNVLTSTKHIYYYLNDWLGVHWVEPTEEEFMAVSDSEAFQAMPLYPDDGSVQIQDGKVVVRLSDHYSPKKEYELQFEQIQGQGPWRAEQN